MYLVISEEYLAKLLADPNASGGELKGRVLDGGKVVRLLDFDDPQNERVGRWLRARQTPTGQPGELLLVAGENSKIETYRVETDGTLTEQEAERLVFYDDYQSRIQGLFDPSGLRDKTIAVIGLGTGGSIAAAELAKAGVGRMRLVDFDRLKVHNLVRHVCGLRDLGRLKTDALKDFLLNTSPFIEIETFNFDVTEDMELLEEVIQGCDLVIGSTDSEVAKALINRVAWENGVPAVYGAAYEMGFGGDIFVAQPGWETEEGDLYGCYQCFRISTADLFGEQPHDEVEDYGAIRPQPALSMDVGMVALLMARSAMGVLLRNDPTARLQPYPSNWILWGNQPQPGWIFDKPLQSRFVDIWAVPDCSVCGLMQDEELAEQAREFVGHLDAPPDLPPGLR